MLFGITSVSFGEARSVVSLVFFRNWSWPHWRKNAAEPHVSFSTTWSRGHLPKLNPEPLETEHGAVAAEFVPLVFVY